MRVFGLALAALVVSSSLAAAQNSAIGGMVYTDSAGTALRGATVTLPALKLSARTNVLGYFRMTGVPAGRHAIEIRHSSYAVLVDTIEAGGDELERQFIMRAPSGRKDSIPRPGTIDRPRAEAVCRDQ